MMRGQRPVSGSNWNEFPHLTPCIPASFFACAERLTHFAYGWYGNDGVNRPEAPFDV